jgi:hypothetical protein
MFYSKDQAHPTLLSLVSMGHIFNRLCELAVFLKYSLSKAIETKKDNTTTFIADNHLHVHITKNDFMVFFFG